MGLLDLGVICGTLIFGPPQALVTRWSYLGELTIGGSFAECESPSKNLANVQKDFPRLKAISKNLLRRR